MRKRRLLVLLLLSAAIAATATPFAKDKPAVGRLLTGKVLDKHDNPLPDAVVYLNDTRTHAIKSYIVSNDGAYRFPELSPCFRCWRASTT
jgi:hypothetical protein